MCALAGLDIFHGFLEMQLENFDVKCLFDVTVLSASTQFLASPEITMSGDDFDYFRDVNVQVTRQILSVSCQFRAGN